MAAPNNSIVFDTGELSAALREILAAVQRRNTIPILSNVLIEADHAGRVRLTATDLDILVTRVIQARSVGRATAFTIAAHRMAEAVGTFEKGSQTAVEETGGAVVVKSGRARLRFAMRPAEDFPRIVQKHVVSAFRIDAKLLSKALGAVRHAISTEETRYYLNGVFLHVRDGRLRFAATDGQRLARFIAEMPAGAENLPGVILRTACVDQVRAAAEARSSDISLSVGDDKVTFDIGDLTIVAKVIDGTYPEYERVIPSQVERTATVDRDELLAAAARVGVASSDKVRLAKLTFSETSLALTVRSAEHGDAIDEVVCDMDGEGEHPVGFNILYLREALNALDADTVKFGLNGPAAATTLTSAAGGNLLLVLMSLKAA
jgi:DNA polymerase-3 subunit beta